MAAPQNCLPTDSRLAATIVVVVVLFPFVAATKISVYSIDYKRGRCNSRSRSHTHSRQSPVALVVAVAVAVD